MRGVPASGDWAGAPWVHQHFESHIFGDTLCTDSCDTYKSAPPGSGRCWWSAQPPRPPSPPCSWWRPASSCSTSSLSNQTHPPPTIISTLNIVFSYDSKWLNKFCTFYIDFISTTTIWAWDRQRPLMFIFRILGLNRFLITGQNNELCWIDI